MWSAEGSTPSLLRHRLLAAAADEHHQAGGVAPGHANVGGQEQAHDAETAPLGDPSFYRYDIDIAAVAELWRRGSVVSSWLLDLAAAALHDSPTLEDFAGRVADSGEGRWTAIAAIEEGVPAEVLIAALSARFSSRGQAEMANRLLSAMRWRFGGHVEPPA